MEGHCVEYVEKLTIAVPPCGEKTHRMAVSGKETAGTLDPTLQSGHENDLPKLSTCISRMAEGVSYYKAFVAKVCNSDTGCSSKGVKDHSSHRNS